MMTKEQKAKIVAAIAAARDNFSGSDTKFANSLGLNAAQYSHIKSGKTDRVVSEPKWISIARLLGVNLSDRPEWRTANTPVFQFITAQLEACQQGALSAMLCDRSDIGKTYTAQHYVRTHRNAVYVDCSQVKTKAKLIRTIAKSFGVGSTGRYSDVYEDLVYYLKELPQPLIILDEAGDLNYEAFLEIKALWNATEMACGYYMMGADGLKAKMQRSIDCKKVGYAELFSRFGRRYGSVIPLLEEDRQKMTQTCAAMIIRANAAEGTDINKVLRSTMGDDNLPSLRRIYKELSKDQLR